MSWPFGYRKEWLAGDLAAGITMAAVVFPQAMAYAALAGLPVQLGLYVSIVPMLAYALLGTSRALSVSTTSTLAILTAGGLSEVARGGDPAVLMSAASSLALAVGLLLVLASVFRLGFLADFISAPVLIGYKAGVGLVIAASQLEEILGVPVHGSGFFGKVMSAASLVSEINPATLGLAAASVAILLGVHRWLPRLPGPLLVVVLGIVVMRLLDPERHGVASIPGFVGGFPTPLLPGTEHLRDLMPAAVGIALMSFVESTAASRAFYGERDPEVRPSRELLALGVANLASGIFRGFPSGGGLSQTAVNHAAGARSQGAEVVTAATVCLLLLFFAPLVAGLADATLGAIVLVSALGLIDLPALRRIHAIRHEDSALSLLAMLGVLVLGVLQGVLAAVVVSMLVVLYALNRPRVAILGRKIGTTIFRNHAVHPLDEIFDGLAIIRPEAPLYFANAGFVRDCVRDAVGSHTPLPRIALLDLSAVPDLDITAYDVLCKLDDELRTRDVILWLAALNTLPREMLRRAAADHSFEGRLFAQLEDAVDAFRARALD